MSEDDAGAVAVQVRELYRRAVALAGELGREYGLHPTDVRALRLLDEAGRDAVTVGELGTRLGLSSAAVSGLVDRLQAVGLVRRAPDPRDRRRVLVELTRDAHRFGQTQLAPLARAIDEAIEAADAAELAAVRRFMAILLERTPG